MTKQDLKNKIESKLQMAAAFDPVDEASHLETERLTFQYM